MFHLSMAKTKKLLFLYVFLILTINSLGISLFVGGNDHIGKGNRVEDIEASEMIYKTEEVEGEIDIIEYIEEVFKDEGEEVVNTMIAIAKYENGIQLRNDKSFDCRATYSNTNGSIDTGVFMVNSVHGYSVEDLSDCKFNIEVAYKIYKSQGITAWSSYNSGKYLMMI